jgi:transforming growth factor-beta-induced protein
MRPTTSTRHGRRRARSLVAVAMAGGLFLAACGGDDDSDSDATSAPAATEAPATEAPPTTEPMDTDTTATDDSMAGGEEMMGASGAGCASVPTDGEGSFDGMADDPAATAASNNPLLSTLVTAVTEAGLVDTLNGEGPFTIFAPTNDAFAKIPAADLNAVLADTDLLTSVLTYHVIGGAQTSAEDLIAQGTATTVNGAEVTFTEGTDGALMVNDATTVCMNVPTANATVHIIDTVLMPAS